ncbi:unnamed protein product [Rhizoctonia solani]|uniref:DUF7918 domain-containing protein n=1 Tax=Rhizoctonia solani TaxID=456999 RepID=A0A8H3H5V0_9AGAM|nr:unnamed protein product [Rhizoctonia solani]
MLLKSVGLSIWVTDAQGVPLPEYQHKQTKDDVTECWIPSTEGANFQIKWQALSQDSIPDGCEVRATPYFDGVRFRSKIGKSKGELRGQRVGHTTIRLYQFGRRVFTDDENVPLYDTAPIDDLGTIRVKIDWGYSQPTDALDYYIDPTRGPIHEKLAKKGFGDSAALGQAVAAPPSSPVIFVKNKEAQTGSFIFRYASEDWLQAREIIPYPLKMEPSAKPNPYVKLEPGLDRKRTRAAAQEVIDVDAIEDDDDEIIFICIKKPKLEGTDKSQL